MIFFLEVNTTISLDNFLAILWQIAQFMVH